MCELQGARSLSRHLPVVEVLCLSDCIRDLTIASKKGKEGVCARERERKG